MRGQERRDQRHPTLWRTGWPTLVLSALACLAPVAPTVAQGPQWDLVWSDEFDGPSVDTGEWDVITLQNSHNNEKQYYLPQQASIVGGNLRITATNQPFGGKQYRSARLESVQTFGPGRFEARIDLPTTQGMWPAFWLNPSGVQWPTGGEIDILENRGSEPELVSSAYHWQTDPGPCCGQHQYVWDDYSATEGGNPVNFHDGFHTYAVEWDQTELRFFVDGNHYHTVTETANRPIFDTPKNIILNLAVGGNFGGDPNGSTIFPQVMDIDYVRVWQQQTGVFYNGGFEESGGSTDGWTIFGNEIGNVSVHSEAVLEGSNSLKLYGQFDGSTNESGAYQGINVTEGDVVQAAASSYVRSADSIVGTNNSALMKIEFYDDFGAGALLDSHELLIADGGVTPDAWDEYMLSAAAPTGAVEARLVLSFLQQSNQSGAVHIDQASFSILTAIQFGDYNGDGTVDGADYTVWQDTLDQTGEGLAADGDGSGTIDAGDYTVWQSHFGQTFPSSGAGASDSSALPEPSSLVLAALALLGLVGTHRRVPLMRCGFES